MTDTVTIVFTGVQGSGKSMLLNAFALKLEEAGFNVKRMDDLHLLKVYNPVGDLKFKPLGSRILDAVK